MAFKTGLTLDEGFRQARNVAASTKQRLQSTASQLTGTYNALTAIELRQALVYNISQLNASAALPGIAAYAQNQYADNTYDVAAEFSTMLAAFQAIVDWLTTNIPSTGVSVTNGLVTGVDYPPTATAPLLTLVNAAIATVA
jgi:hypothetical protein